MISNILCRYVHNNKLSINIFKNIIIIFYIIDKELLIGVIYVIILIDKMVYITLFVYYKLQSFVGQV